MILKEDRPWYLAGPMSGIPAFNYPMFDRVAASLRDKGMNIISPAELDTPELRAKILQSPDGVLTDELKAESTWGDYLAHDVKVIADVAQGILLMENWHLSKGARIEAYIGLTVGSKFRMVAPAPYGDGFITAVTNTDYVKWGVNHVAA